MLQSRSLKLKLSLLTTPLNFGMFESFEMFRKFARIAQSLLPAI